MTGIPWIDPGAPLPLLRDRSEAFFDGATHVGSRLQAPALPGLSQEARQFIIELQRTKASMNRQAMVALALQGSVNGFGTEFGDDAAKALDDGIRRGTSDARRSSVDAVRRQYHSCKTEAFGSTADQQAVQPPSSAPTSAEVQLREEAFSAGRAARIIVERAKSVSKQADAISYEAIRIAKKAEDPNLEGARRVAYSDGTIYVGQMNGDQRHGLGIANMPSGQSHMGEWIGNQRGGLGVAFVGDDTFYAGQFLVGQATGMGAIERRNNARRSGKFKEGYADGLSLRQTLSPPFETRTGEFKRGELDGLGSEALDGRVIYVGQYRNGQRHGFGLIIGPSGEEEPSQWDQGKRIYPSTAGAPLASKGQQQVATATSKEVARPAPNAPNLAAVVTASEIEGVRQKIRQCLPPSATSAPSIPVALIVDLNASGSPTKAEFVDYARYQSNPTYRAVADAARSAILNSRCHPWPLSREKYASWRQVRFNFDARDY